MNTTKISENEITTNSVQSLPTRPNAPHTFGGEGLTAADSAKIYDIIVSETGASADKIKIIEIKTEYKACILNSLNKPTV